MKIMSMEQLANWIKEKYPDGILIMTPQFDRTDGIIPDKPGDKRYFDYLKKLPHEDLIALGLGLWEENHYLYPAEWYDFIPDGYPIDTINDVRKHFKHGETDDDKRFSMLAYGFIKDNT